MLDTRTALVTAKQLDRLAGMFRHRERIQMSRRIQMGTWVPFEGPRGGHGAKSVETGEVVYGEAGRELLKSRPNALDDITTRGNNRVSVGDTHSSAKGKTMITKPKAITWIAPTSVPGVGGKTLTGGVYVKHPQAGRAIDFGTVMPNGDRLVVRLAGKPELEAELERYQKEKEEYNRAVEEERNEKRLAIENGEKVIEPRYRDGEYLSGYEVFGQEAELLEKIGAAKHVRGWGTNVEPKVIDALGNSFTYPQALEFVRPAREAETQKREAAAAARAAKFDEAQRTDKPVVLHTWTETRRAQEGGEWGEYLFAVTEYANPDGSVSKTAVNTY